MPQRPADIDPHLLRRLYVVEGLTMAQIGRRLGYAQSTIRRHMARAGIVPRRPGRYIDLPEWEIAERVRMGASVRVLAKEYGCSPETIRYRALRARRGIR